MERMSPSHPKAKSNSNGSIPHPRKSSALLAAFQFHVSSGIRVALGLGSLGIVAFFALVALQPYARVFLRDAALGVLAGGGASSAPYELALAAVVSALAAGRRAVLGTRGWESSLPIGARSGRRAFVAALVVSQILVIVLWVLFWTGGVALGGTPRPASLVAVLWVAAAAATAATPFARWWPRVLGWGALVSAAHGGWAGMAGATVLLGATDRWGGGLAGRRSRRRRPHPARLSRLALSLLAWRSLGWRVPALVAGSLLPVAAAWLTLRNNAVLSPGEASVIVRGGAAVATAWVIGGLAANLTLRRPPWGWSRSLPWSARARVLSDAGFLFVLAVPALTAGLVLDAGAAWPTLGFGLYLAARGAGAVRRNAESASGLGWRFTSEIWLLTLMVAALAPLGAGLAVLVPAAAWLAERNEKTQKPSRHRERQYFAVGDPTS